MISTAILILLILLILILFGRSVGNIILFFINMYNESHEKGEK